MNLAVNWLDLVIVVVIVGAASVGLKRGFGRAIFDFAAVLLALRVTEAAYIPLSKSIQFSADKNVNSAWSYAIIFIVAGVILWFIGKAAYDTTLISLDTFDPPLGAVLGIGIAIVVAHVIARSAFLATVNENGISQFVQQSRLGLESYGFFTYHNIIDTLKRLGE